MNVYNDNSKTENKSKKIYLMNCALREYMVKKKR